MFFGGAVHAGWPVSVSQSRELTVAKPLPLQTGWVSLGPLGVFGIGFRALKKKGLVCLKKEEASIEIRDWSLSWLGQ